MTLSDRLAALAPRERKFLAVGGAALLLFLLYLLLAGGGGEEGPVELAAAPPPPAPALIQPAPLPVVTAPPPPVAAAPAPASATGVVLQGVSGGGPGGGAALFQFPSGGQRLVRIGREIVPGLLLKSVGPTYALAGSGETELRLDLGKSGAVQVAAVASASAAAPVAAGPAADRVETTELRLGLKPVASDGRVRGYEFRQGASLPRLQQAGLRPGDIITGVNGSTLSEDQLMELSWTMSNSEKTEFDVIRDGKPLKLALQPASVR